MPDFDLSQIGKDIAELATRLFQQHTQQVIADGQQFASDMQAAALELVRTRADITAAEYDDGKRDLRLLARMEGIKQRGLSKVTIDRFTNGVIDIVLEAAEAAL